MELLLPALCLAYLILYAFALPFPSPSLLPIQLPLQPSPPPADAPPPLLLHTFSVGSQELVLGLPRISPITPPPPSPPPAETKEEEEEASWESSSDWGWTDSAVGRALRSEVYGKDRRKSRIEALGVERCGELGVC